ncbi:MAG TPA: DUF1786 family protein [Syntrophales bacterium]|nr:DUF1786 family protein [Syntrophales bacterium]
MSRFLLIDIGAGTMDILYYDSSSQIHYKAVVKSPVRTLAETVAAIPGHLLVTGTEMGGGAVSNILEERARYHEVAMSVSSAATIHHDMERVRSLGIRVVGDQTADEMRNDTKYRHVVLGDLQPERLEQIVTGFGVPFAFDVVGACAQDHGVPPPGMSHLDYRHKIFTAALNGNPCPHTLLYESGTVPETMNRLSSIASCAGTLPTNEVYVMDSGMAAIVGASMDISARSKENIIVMDVATSHTLCAALTSDEIAGFFEYHTRDITKDRMEQLIPDLANGRISHEQILQEGGHGAYLRKSFGFDAVDILIATGPRRGILEGSHLPITFGAPGGDNMMTGTIGLLESIRRHKGLEPIRIL